MEKNLCITLVIYEESLHDARSTKYKILHICLMRLSVFIQSCEIRILICSFIKINTVQCIIQTKIMGYCLI